MKFRVPDMTCGHCTRAVEQAVAEAGGRARADLESLTVEVEGLDTEAAARAIREAGYSPAPA